MNIHLRPDLLERLAQAYALGTLRGHARRRFEALARERSSVRAAALVWQTRLASLTELQVPVAPSPTVWTRINNLVQADLQERAMQAARAAPSPAPGGWLRNLALWRGAAAAGVAATLVLAFTGLNTRQQMGSEIARLQTELLAQPQVDYVAVLADDKSQASVLVTFDPKSKRLTLQRVGGFQEATDRSLQLWALPNGGAPRSLGVLGGDKLLRLAAEERDVREVPALAISLEPKGGVPGAGGPTGPVLFKGALIQKML
jgi:anti-sigma-K factor RskA